MTARAKVAVNPDMMPFMMVAMIILLRSIFVVASGSTRAAVRGCVPLQADLRQGRLCCCCCQKRSGLQPSESAALAGAATLTSTAKATRADIMVFMIILLIWL
jgi:hypothetical protein